MPKGASYPANQNSNIKSRVTELVFWVLAVKAEIKVVLSWSKLSHQLINSGYNFSCKSTCKSWKEMVNVLSHFEVAYSRFIKSKSHILQLSA